MADEPIDLDSLASKILAKLATLKGKAADPDDYDDLNPPNKVPFDRMRREVERVRELRAEIDALKGQVEQLGTGYQTATTKLQTDTAEQVKLLGQRHAEDLALVDVGFTDALGRQALRTAWDAQPKESRGKSAAEWWTGVLAARKAHGEDNTKPAPEVPKILTPYLPEPDLPEPEQVKPGPNNRKVESPAGPGKREPAGLSSVPIDQGMDAFFAGINKLG